MFSLVRCRRFVCRLLLRVSESGINVSDHVLFSDSSGSVSNSLTAPTVGDVSNLDLEDVSDNRRPSYLVPSFNLAAYANKSPTLQRLVDLGVSLHRIERTRGGPGAILKYDFDRDMKKHIKFLCDNGVPLDFVGEFITQNPFIFTQDLENLEIRINYLCSKKFTSEAISRILTKNPKWLMFSVEDIDEKLGYFQQDFLLNGDEVRFVAVRRPKLITYDLSHIKDTTFAVREEMGFTHLESKQIILKKPKIYTLNRRSLTSRFNYIHNSMRISHSLIIDQLEGLLCREQRLKDRHEFLSSLGKSIYDPKLPGYISLTSLVLGSDSDFCQKVALVPVSYFNKFLKTR